MKKVRTRVGHYAYEITAEENALIGGAGICDHCNKKTKAGFLVPVLNQYQCKRCFNDFCRYGKYFKEDEAIEAKNMAYYENAIKRKGENEMKYEDGKLNVMGKDVVNDIPNILSETNQVDETLINIANEGVIQQENDRKHYDSLTKQAMAMSKEEQEATARGLHPIIMLREIEATLIGQENKINRVKGAFGDE